MRSRTTQSILTVVVATIGMLALVACNRDQPAATSTGTPSATSSATSSPTPTATSSPTPTGPPLATGEAIPPIVGQVISAVVSKQTSSLVPLIAYQQVGCTTAQGLGGPPKCKPGDAQGTVYRVFPSGTCEGEWATDGAATITQLVPTFDQLYAAAKVAAPNPDPEPYWPKGESVVVFSGANGAPGGYLVLNATQIVRAHRVCGAATTAAGLDALLKNLGATTFYIAPATR